MNDILAFHFRLVSDGKPINNGGVTVAYVFLHSQELNNTYQMGVAVATPENPFNRKLGFRIAAGRASLRTQRPNYTKVEITADNYEKLKEHACAVASKELSRVLNRINRTRTLEEKISIPAGQVLKLVTRKRRIKGTPIQGTATPNPSWDVPGHEAMARAEAGE